jgi:DNA-binding XRE family transcriptional regulator
LQFSLNSQNISLTKYNVCINEHLILYLYVIINIMANKKIVLLPKARKILTEVGENIKLARLRRKLSSEQVAQRANIGRTTLYHIEKGDPGVSIGAYLQVMMALRLGEDFLLLAKDDELGRKLQDAKLITKERAPKRNK